MNRWTKHEDAGYTVLTLTTPVKTMRVAEWSTMDKIGEPERFQGRVHFDPASKKKAEFQTAWSVDDRSLITPLQIFRTAEEATAWAESMLMDQCTRTMAMFQS